ncbi:MAG: hypothetical protein KF841_14140 [Phycisphaerae bacterium]|nr:hypothetical protein [Phycisphaerae bacterium]
MAYSLIINGSIVLGDAPAGALPIPVSLVTFERNYDDPAELVIRVDGTWRGAPWACDTPARLERDGTIVFEGLIYLPIPVATQQDFPAVKLSILDRSHALRFDPAVNNDGFPEINLATGTLSSVIASFFAMTNVAAIMSAKGVSTSADFVAGADTVQCLPVSLGGESIDEAVRKIAASAPGVRVFLAPPASAGDAPRYRFVRLYQTNAYDLTIDTTRVEQLSLTPSLDGRGGAVRTLGGKTQAGADVEVLEDVPLIPAWAVVNPPDPDPDYLAPGRDATNESNWTLKDAFDRTKETGEYANEFMAAVYRRFTWERNDLTEDMIRVAHVERVHDDNPDASRWVARPIESIDIANRVLWLKNPAIATRLVRNPHAYRYYSHRGRSVAMAAKLRVRTEGTAATPIYIASHRVPETGFQGRAFQMAPIRCANELIIKVPAGVNVEQYCIAAHAALSEPTILGEVPLDGDLPAELFTLARRINLRTASHGSTGFEDLGAPLLGVSLAFDPAVRSSLKFNRDDSQQLPEGGE